LAKAHIIERAKRFSFVSAPFFDDKADGSKRFIIDNSRLNPFLLAPQFRLPSAFQVARDPPFKHTRAR
jgi:hypothetical protein